MLFRYLPWVSVALFVLSCCLPVMTLTKVASSGTEVWWGLAVLAFGWLGIPDGMYAWGANILWLAGTIFLVPSRGKGVAAILLAGALLLGLQLQDFTLPLRHRPDIPKFALQLHAGAWVWLAALAMQFAVGLVALVRRR